MIFVLAVIVWTQEYTSHSHTHTCKVNTAEPERKKHAHICQQQSPISQFHAEMWPGWYDSRVMYDSSSHAFGTVYCSKSKLNLLLASLMTHNAAGHVPLWSPRTIYSQRSRKESMDQTKIFLKYKNTQGPTAPAESLIILKSIINHMLRGDAEVISYLVFHHHQPKHDQT